MRLPWVRDQTDFFLRSERRTFKVRTAQAGACSPGLPSQTNNPTACLLERRQTSERHRNLFSRIIVVLQLPRLVGNVTLHVEVPMPTQVEQNRARLPFRLG